MSLRALASGVSRLRQDRPPVVAPLLPTVVLRSLGRVANAHACHHENLHSSSNPGTCTPSACSRASVRMVTAGVGLWMIARNVRAQSESNLLLDPLLTPRKRAQRSRDELWVVGCALRNCIPVRLHPKMAASVYPGPNGCIASARYTVRKRNGPCSAVKTTAAVL